jgi:hypothetical protein
MSDLSHDARELLQVARHEDGPTPAERERLRRAVFGAVAGSSTVFGSAGAVGASATAGSGAKLSLVAGITAKMSTAPLAIWFAVGTAAGLASVAPAAAVRYVTSSTPQGVMASTATTASRVAQREPAPPSHEPFAPDPLPAAAIPTETEGPPSSVTAPAVASEEKSIRASASAPSAPSTPALEPPPLTQELDLLGTAQRELAAGRAEQALAWLGKHERRFPSGALRGERLAARVFALCALGRTEEATRATREFERAAPGSPLTPRVLASCGGTTAGVNAP